MALAAAAAIVALLAVAPTPAQAITIPNPVDLVTGGLDDVAVGAFDAIIGHLFAPVTKFVTGELIAWLVAIPDFSTGTHIARLQTT